MAGPVQVGSVTLANPVMTASGTAGYGTELGAYFDLAELGAIVVKSLAAYEWAGNPAPRLHPTPGGMLNAVGLQGPGVPYWLDHVLPDLVRTDATVVASIWGRTVDEFARAADLLATAPPEVVAVEVNLSCPNLDHGAAIFAHDADESAAVVAATAGCGRPRWAKLSANTDRIVDVARRRRSQRAPRRSRASTRCSACRSTRRRVGRPSAPAGAGCPDGPSTPSPCAPSTTSTWRCLTVPIVGVGGVASGWDGAELLLAGATAVQVGTATFADPRARRGRCSESWRRGRISGGQLSPRAASTSHGSGIGLATLAAWLHLRN